MKKSLKPLLCVLVLVMSVSLIMVFSLGGCRPAVSPVEESVIEEPVVEEVTDEPEEALDESEKEEIVEEATATSVTPLPTTEQRWQEVTTSAPNALWDVDFVNNNIGWVVGDVGTILYTSNGGASWTAQISRTTQDLIGIHFFTESNGIAVGPSGTVLETTDGGVTWAKQSFPTTGYLSEIAATDSSHR